METITLYEEKNREVLAGYVDLNHASRILESDDTRNDIARHIKSIDEVEESVKKLQVLISEMDEWSKELSVKIQRLL